MRFSKQELSSLFVIEGTNKAACGFRRGVVELTMFNAAESAELQMPSQMLTVANSNVTLPALSDRLPSVRILKLHFPLSL